MSTSHRLGESVAMDATTWDLPWAIARWVPVVDDHAVVDMCISQYNAVAAVRLGLAGSDVPRLHLRRDLPSVATAGLWDVMLAVWNDGVERRYDLRDQSSSFVHDVTLTRVGDHLMSIDLPRRRQWSPGADQDHGQLLQRALDASDDAFAIYRAERDGAGRYSRFRLIFLNAAGAAGYTGGADSLIGLELSEFFPAAETVGLRAAFLEAMTSGQRVPTHLEVGVGSWQGILESTQVPLGGDLILSTWRDVTERVQVQRTAAAAYDETAAVSATLQTALDATSDAFAVYEVVRDVDARVTGLRLIAINAAGAAPLAGSADELLGKDLLQFFPEALDTGLWDVILTAVASGDVARHRVQVHDAAGEWQAAFDNTVAPAGDNRVVITWRDASDIVASARALAKLSDEAHHDATHDALTALPNRALFHDRLEQALLEQRVDHRTGLLFLDIDHFKAVNDTWGHVVGDLLLQTVAGQLSALVRRGDTVARLGGDEFVLVLRDLPAGWSADELFDRVLASLSEPLEMESNEAVPTVRVTASLGLVLSPPFPPDIEIMLREADHAMYDSKRAGRDRGTVAGDSRETDR